MSEKPNRACGVPRSTFARIEAETKAETKAETQIGFRRSSSGAAGSADHNAELYWQTTQGAPRRMFVPVRKILSSKRKQISNGRLSFWDRTHIFQLKTRWNRNSSSCGIAIIYLHNSKLKEKKWNLSSFIEVVIIFYVSYFEDGSGNKRQTFAYCLSNPTHTHRSTDT